MQPITFYTFTDIHQQVMDKFEHKAYIEREIIYIRVSSVKRGSIGDLSGLYKSLKQHVAVKSLKSLQTKARNNDTLLAIDYIIIRNELYANELTRVKHILNDLPNILPINEKRTGFMKLLIDKQDMIINDTRFDIYRKPKNNSIDQVKDIPKQDDDQLMSDDSYDSSYSEDDDSDTNDEPGDMYEKYQKPLLLQLDTIIEKTLQII